MYVPACGVVVVVIVDVCHLKACTLYAVGSDGSMAQSFCQDRGGVSWMRLSCGREEGGDRLDGGAPHAPRWCPPLFWDVGGGVGLLQKHPLV